MSENYGNLLSRSIARQDAPAEAKEEKAKTANELSAALRDTCKREDWNEATRMCIAKAANLVQLEKCPKPGQKKLN